MCIMSTFFRLILLSRYSLYSQNVNLYLAPTADARDTWLPLMRTIACEGRTYVLSANQCIRRRNLPPWILGTSTKATEDEVRSAEHAIATSRRRSSITTRTEYNHEICWPNPESTTISVGNEPKSVAAPNGTSPLRTSTSAVDDEPRPKPVRRKSTITKLENNHELVLPLASDPSMPEEAVSTPDVSTNESKKLNDSKDDIDFVSRGGSCIIGPAGQVLAGPLWDVEDGGFLSVKVDFEDCERGRLDLDVAGSYSRNDAFKLEVAGLDISPPP